MLTREDLITTARQLSGGVTEILPPVEVIHRCAVLAREHPAIRAIEIGQTESGQPLLAYQAGQGSTPVLLYGFPDPGEAIGGTTILTLLQALAVGDHPVPGQDVTWHFIPCLNFDDQPDDGRSLSDVFRDLNVREVDWCVSNPRAETRALLKYVDVTSPRLVFPLHDEYHCGESIPCYFIVSECLKPDLCEGLRACLRVLGVELTSELSHPSMGQGFGITSELVGEEYANSTFSRMADHGLVALCELSRQDGQTPQSLVATQLAVTFHFLEAVLQRGNETCRSR